MGSIMFKYICADCGYGNNVLLTLNDDYDAFQDCVDDCLIWCTITFYGIPMGFTDDQMDEIYDRNYYYAVPIGRLKGCLILNKRLLELGEDPLEICDDADADLEFIMSALVDTEGPLNEETGDPLQDVFYIHEIEIGKEYGDLYKGKIIDSLPDLLFSFLHVEPDIIAYCPAPLEYTRDPAEAERQELLMRIAAQKAEHAEQVFEAVMGKKPKQQNDSTLSFAGAYRFTEDELKFLTRRRHSGSSYPEGAKDPEEYAFYEKHGYKEAGSSRVLYRLL